MERIPEVIARLRGWPEILIVGNDIPWTTSFSLQIEGLGPHLEGDFLFRQDHDNLGFRVESCLRDQAFDTVIGNGNIVLAFIEYKTRPFYDRMCPSNMDGLQVFRQIFQSTPSLPTYLIIRPEEVTSEIVEELIGRYIVYPGINRLGLLYHQYLVAMSQVVRQYLPANILNDDDDNFPYTLL